MSLVVDTAPPPGRRLSRRLRALAVGWRDILGVAALLTLWAALLVWRADAVPLQLWDESRNANNALEMAQHGGWLTPTYGGVVDHWNTKPPLLIWAMVGWLRLGLPALTAVRLTSWLAAAATALTLWGVLRYAMKDRLAGLAAGALLFAAALYIGPHAARTGDYDALESAFVLGYALAVWRALEHGRAAWLLLAAALISLGVLTKGVAALLPAPGLCVYALSRPAPLIRLLKDGRTWVAAAVFGVLIGGYYASRELYDPGYLSAVAGNELGGRFLKVTENHRGPWYDYLRRLLASAEPCTALSGLALLTVFGRDTRRRRLALASALTAASLLGVLSASSSKMAWYATPAVPLLSLLGGLGLSDTLRLVRVRAPRWRRVAEAAAAAVLLGGAAFGLWWNQSGASWRPAYADPAHLRYRELFDVLSARGGPSSVTVVDTGFPNDAGFAAYDPMLGFWAAQARRRGSDVRIVHAARGLAPGGWAASCDAAAIRALVRTRELAEGRTLAGCVYGRVRAPRLNGRSAPGGLAGVRTQDHSIKSRMLYR